MTSAKQYQSLPNEAPLSIITVFFGFGATNKKTNG